MSSLQSTGELGLIRRIQTGQPPYGAGVLIGIGDDTAAIQPTPGAIMLLTTDTFVEGLDFDTAFSTWRQIGFKSMAANVSDIAAMGGTPLYALVTLCLPDHRTPEEVAELYAGIRQLNETCGASVAIIGGDLSGTTGPTVISITLTGETTPDCLIPRSGAKIGDTLCVTGAPGASEAGLRLLLHARRQPDRRAFLAPYAATLDKHRTPLPRLRESRILAQSGQVHAMIDLSDGLSSDAWHIARNSGVGLYIDADALPVAPETRAAAETLGLSATDLSLDSGEEFELLCAVAPEAVAGLARTIMDETGVPLTPIGVIAPQEAGCVWHDTTGNHPLIPSGYEHFRSLKGEV